MFREDFEILNKGTIFFDNAATTLKPNVYNKAFNDYVNKYTSNINRSDYDASIYCSNIYEKLKQLVANYTNSYVDEIILTSGATHSLNQIIFGYYQNILKKDDEVIISQLEHASNFIPWLVLKEKLGIKIKYAPLKDNLELDYQKIESIINNNTKVISLAHITNTLGDERDLLKLSQIANKYNLDLVIDAAQSFAKSKIDFNKLNISFYAASFHKAYGPTGLGILIANSKKTSQMKPIFYGGAMNDDFNINSFSLKEVPYCFEAGTLNVEGIIKAYEVMKYLIDKDIAILYRYAKDLKKYLVQELSRIKGITIYNKDIDSSIILFNVDGIFPQDVAIFLNKYHINIRSGNHCVKTSDELINIKNTCRISLDFYNIKEEIDKFIEVIKNINNIYEEIL